jgi:hypothetical protein
VGELGTAFGDDSAVDEDVNVVGINVVENSLIVGDDDGAHLRPDELAHAAGHDSQRVDVKA